MKEFSFKHWFFLILLCLTAATIRAQGTAFTYQGFLTDNGSPANGIYEFRFTLHNVETGGTPLGAEHVLNGVGVTNGVFTVTLDFGNVFDGGPRWLEIRLRRSTGGPFITVSPRQPVTPTPYAIRSLQVVNGAITSQSLADGAVTTSKLAPGAVNQLGGPGGSPINAVQVDTNGLVGIGTTTPEAGLHITAGAALLVPQMLFQVRDGMFPYTNLSSASHLALQGNLAAITASGDGAVTFVDVSNPSSPEFRGQIWDGLGAFTNLSGASGVAWAGSNLIVAAKNDNAVTIISVTNLLSPALVATLRDGAGGFNELGGAFAVAVSGNLLAIGAAEDNAVTLADISSPVPTLRSVIKNGTNGFNDLDDIRAVALSGNLLAIAAEDSSAVTLVDVSNPPSPVLRATLKDGQGGFTSLFGASGVAFSGNLLAIAGSFDDAVTLVDVSNPSAPVKLAEIQEDVDKLELDGAVSMAFVGTTLAIASKFAGTVTLLDISDPVNPKFLAKAKDGNGFDFLSGAGDLAFVGPHLIVCAAFDDAYSVMEFENVAAGLISRDWVGIGTSYPSAPLHVVGNFLVDDADFVSLDARRIAIGEDATASTEGALAIGEGAVAGDFGATAIGVFATATGNSSTAIGSYSTARAFNSVAVGDGAEALHSGTFVWNGLGGTLSSTANNQFLIGASGVGIGTASPQARLDVRGDIRFGSSGQFRPPAAEENLRMLRGVISAPGAILEGTGYTVTRTAVGSYTVTFTGGFADLPAVTVSPQAGIPRMATTTNVGSNAFQVRIFDATGTLVDAQFHFTAIGPR